MYTDLNQTWCCIHIWWQLAKQMQENALEKTHNFFFLAVEQLRFRWEGYPDFSGSTSKKTFIFCLIFSSSFFPLMKKNSYSWVVQGLTPPPLLVFRRLKEPLIFLQWWTDTVRYTGATTYFSHFNCTNALFICVENLPQN